MHNGRRRYLTRVLRTSTGRLCSAARHRQSALAGDCRRGIPRRARESLGEFAFYSVIFIPLMRWPAAESSTPCPASEHRQAGVCRSVCSSTSPYRCDGPTLDIALHCGAAAWKLYFVTWYLSRDKSTQLCFHVTHVRLTAGALMSSLPGIRVVCRRVKLQTL
ncbi:hypothetical protein EVAR_54263_1 [Eumeta japonica]|uniref:Uncharacterized protein n=1 Tax=Eumeta variegata TaxID=151549 RepID=A0A4C1YIP3_EUMVA|nr:hypothetical protein EVAR_54263_1 [Eumeta japonica]